MTKCNLQDQTDQDTSEILNESSVEVKNPLTESITEVKTKTVEQLTCPKCGKIYAPHTARHLKAHIPKCNGFVTPDSSQLENLVPSSSDRVISKPEQEVTPMITEER